MTIDAVTAGDEALRDAGMVVYGTGVPPTRAVEVILDRVGYYELVALAEAAAELLRVAEQASPDWVSYADWQGALDETRDALAGWERRG